MRQWRPGSLANNSCCTTRLGQQTTLFVPVSKASVINTLKGCLNISPPVPEQCLLAFSASSQYSHRFNSEVSSILVCSTLKQKRWQLHPHSYRETERRNFPFSGSNSSRLSLVVQQKLFAKDPVKRFEFHQEDEITTKLPGGLE